MIADIANMKSYTKLAATVFSSMIVFSSCKKSESDYIGQYETFTCQSVKIADKFNSYAFFSRSDEGRSAKNYCVLNEVKITLFEDESTKNTKGEGRLSLVSVNNFSTRPSASTDNISFDLKNMRLENDTLKFQITNRSLEQQNKTIYGLLYKDGSTSIVGLEKSMYGVNEFTKKNPFYLKESKDMIYYTSVTEKNKDWQKDFYKAQIDEYQKRIQSKYSKKDEKEILTNSINAINAEYLKN